MAIFDFPFHQVQDEYPDSSPSIHFGRGYQFAARPMGPDQLTFRLSFPVMFWFFDDSGNLSSSPHPQLNFKRFLDFYEEHLTYEKFTYVHSQKGAVECRFLRPIVTPKGIQGQVSNYSGYKAHRLEPFEVQLISQP